MTSEPALAVALFTQLDSLSGTDLARWRFTLPEVDKGRLAAFQSPARKRTFIAGRYLLYQLFERTRGLSAEVACRPSGQPSLSVDGAHFACSISHSAAALLVAYSTAGPVGVDIEARKNIQSSELVERFFHPQEQKAYRSLTEQHKLPWFYDRWCRKEALLKLAGKGISEAALSTMAERCPGAGMWHLTVPGYSAAIASACGREPTVFRFTRESREEAFLPFEQISAVLD